MSEILELTCDLLCFELSVVCILGGATVGATWNSIMKPIICRPTAIFLVASLVVPEEYMFVRGYITKSVSFLIFEQCDGRIIEMGRSVVYIAQSGSLIQSVAHRV